MKMWHHVVVPVSTDGGLRGHERCRSSCSRSSAPSSVERHRDLMTNSPEETPNHMFQQPHRLLLHQLGYHVAQDGANRIESLVGMTYISKS